MVRIHPFQPDMPYGDAKMKREHDRAYSLAWYALPGNAAKRRAKIRARGRALLAWIRALKSGPCVDCGTSFPPEAMDFDHRDRALKVYNISRAVHTGWSRARVLTEIAKCDLRCANCHRIKTRRDNEMAPVRWGVAQE